MDLYKIKDVKGGTTTIFAITFLVFSEVDKA